MRRHGEQFLRVPASLCFIVEKSARNIAVPGFAPEAAPGVEAFFFTRQTFPANNFFLVRRAEKNVEVFHFAVAFRASDGRFFHRVHNFTKTPFMVIDKPCRFPFQR